MEDLPMTSEISESVQASSLRFLLPVLQERFSHGYPIGHLCLQVSEEHSGYI